MSNETSAIDKKKEGRNSENKDDFVSNIGDFLTTLLILFLLILAYYGLSGLVLYACKLGQSNILPTELKCFPYEDVMPNIQPIQTNIFTTFTDPQLSMKMSFPYDKYNASNKILDMFREYKKEPKSHFLANYFISIMESLIHFNYSSFNTILNMLNGLPEFLLVFFGPIIVGIISTIIFLLDHLYVIYLWFINMKWFFKTNSNKTNEGEPKWEDVTLLSPINYACAVSLVILFVMVFFPAMPFMSFLSFFTMAWCMLSCLTFKAEMYSKSITASAIIQDIFKYYKVPIMGIFSFFVVVSAFSKLGLIPGIFSIITLVLIYFGIITIDIFKSINQDDLSAVTSYDQAKKTCVNNKEQVKEKHGLLYNMLFGQKGGNLVKELKKLSKNKN